MTNKNSMKRGVLSSLATLACLFSTVSSRLSLLSPISLQSKFISNQSVLSIYRWKHFSKLCQLRVYPLWTLNCKFN